MDTSFNDLLMDHITNEGLVAKAERHLLDTPKAKRVRPKFLVACGALLDIPASELKDIAAAVEIMHTATLLHDDIIDKADERRGLPSTNAQYGNTMAILAGDWLFSRSLAIMADMKDGAKAVKQAAMTLMEIIESMAAEDERALADVTKDELIKIADGKTGALFGLCGYLPGLAAQDNEAATHFMQAGRFAGRAFQLRDDIDDLEEDAANNVPTLPQLVSPEEVEEVIVAALGEAAKQLKPYADRPGYKELIENMYMLARTPMP